MVRLKQKRGVFLANNRDDFSETTKRILANRAGVKCSNPSCRKSTSGANDDPKKVINIGVAAHICAAAEGGPRYDASMKPDQRKSLENGIWLCQTCAKLVDSDPLCYTKEVLHNWKQTAEIFSKNELEKNMGLDKHYAATTNQDIKSIGNKWFINREKKQDISWGYRTIDDRYRLLPGTVAMIAGYSDRDNSIFAQNIVFHNIKRERKVIYFNLKENTDIILNRFLSIESGIETELISTGMLTDGDWDRIVQGINLIGNDTLRFEAYNLSYSMSQRVLSAVQDGNADIVVIDDVSGLGLEGVSLSSFMYQLRSVAADRKVVVLLLLDIINKPNRIDKRPLATDPEIKCLYKFCDVAQFLYKDEYGSSWEKSKDELEVILSKCYDEDKAYTIRLTKESGCSAMKEYLNCDSKRRELSARYPGLLAGVKVLSERLEEY